MKVVSVETMRQIEAAADASGVSYDTMMQNAGRAVAARVLKVMSERYQHEDVRVTVLVGPGNNGGDGLVAARVIAQESKAQVRCYLLKKRADDDPNFAAAREAGIFIANAQDDQRYRVLHNMVASAHILVDALFGVGVRLPLHGDAEKVLRVVQQALADEPEFEAQQTVLTPNDPASLPQRTVPYVIAVDCPSGLDCDSGELDKQAIPADETVTFIAAKPGLFIFPGAEAVGHLSIAPIGVPADIDGLKDEHKTIADASAVRKLLPPRSSGAHKGTFGKVLIVGGSVNYTGAPGLAAEAAYRAGAGLVTLAAPQPVVSAVAAHLLEVTWILLPQDMGVIAESAATLVREEAARFSALLVGPGFGREDTTGDMLRRLLQHDDATSRARRPIGFLPGSGQAAHGEAAGGAQLPPLVIDADGLFLLSKIETWWALLPQNTILTPHPGEMAQLTGLDSKEIQANRWEIAASKAAEWNVVLVLKGAHTLIATPSGRVTVLPFKTAALATAGTGDVLAGTIVGLLAQGLEPYDAAVAGGYLHGLAGQLMEEQVGKRGAVAGDIARYGLPQAVGLLEGN